MPGIPVLNAGAPEFRVANLRNNQIPNIATSPIIKILENIDPISAPIPMWEKR